jgi:hypothetical protein
MRLIRSFKCAHCSFPFLDGELVVFERGDLFHKPCLRITRSVVRVKESHELRKRSREIVEAARKVFLAHRTNRSARDRSVLRLVRTGEPDQ